MSYDAQVAWNGVSGNAWVELQDVTDRMFRPIEDILTREAAAGHAHRVLDIGCGTGVTTVALARVASNATGLDISEPMIAAARERAQRETSPATFLCANAQTEPLPPAAFDWLTSRFGVMFFDDFPAAFRNLRGATAPGGQLRFVTWRSAAENPFMTAAEKAAAPLLPELPPREPNAPGQFGLADPDRVVRFLEQAGWSDIDLEPLDVECALPTADLERYMTRLGPVGMTLPQVDAARRAQVVAAIRIAFDPYVRNGEARFTAACWMIRARRPAAE